MSHNFSCHTRIAMLNMYINMQFYERYKGKFHNNMQLIFLISQPTLIFHPNNLKKTFPIYKNI